jgi:hypothetical protein
VYGHHENSAKHKGTPILLDFIRRITSRYQPTHVKETNDAESKAKISPAITRPEEITT